MPGRRPWMHLLLLAVAVTAMPWQLFAEDLPAKTALDDYVNKPDAAYEWELANSVKSEGMTVYFVRMTSQEWRTTKDVNRTEWTHWLTIIKPDDVKSDTAMLFISGGKHPGNDPPGGPSERVAQIAAATGAVVAELSNVPAQPLIYHNDGIERVEDDLIGYAWDQFLKTGDPTWAPRLPMVKSAVRAMDTITALLASPKGGEVKVDKFVVSGGSKRGWTTWLTGVVDDRVVAIIPIVIDVLNVNTSMRHHFAAYGFWAPAIGNYYQHKIMQQMDNPRLQELYDLVDPYSYRHRLQKPKFIVNGSGDQFFLPDSSQFYYDDLQGEKHIRYVQNADHSLNGSDAIESIAAFFWMIINDVPRPEFDWTFEEDGSIKVVTKTKPAKVTMWQAHNPKARDFRLERIDKAYKPTELEDQGDGVYVAQIDEPSEGWSASFVELTFDVEGCPVPVKFSTAVRVLPDVLPFADKNPAEGTLEPAFMKEYERRMKEQEQKRRKAG